MESLTKNDTVNGDNKYQICLSIMGSYVKKSSCIFFSGTLKLEVQLSVLFSPSNYRLPEKIGSL